MSVAPSSSPLEGEKLDSLSHYLASDLPMNDDSAADSLADEKQSLEFEMLALQLSLESGRYSFMTMFILKILNLTNDSQILLQNASQVAKFKTAFEILPHVFLPHDLWLNHYVAIPNATQKICLLREANNILKTYLNVLEENELMLVDDEQLQNFEKRASRFCSLQVLEERSSATEAINAYDQPDDKTQAFSVPPLSNPKLRSPASPDPQTPISRNPTSSSRMPNYQRDFQKVKRKHSFLGHISLTPGPAYFESMNSSTNSPLLSPLSPNPATVSPPRPSNSSIFSKSKLYSKIKRRRELQALVLSVSTNGSSGATSLKPVSSNSEFSTLDIDAEILAERCLENQTQKHSYYVQVRIVKETIEQLLKNLKRPGILPSLVKLLDFVKSFVFKLIMVDTCQMIINYTHAKVIEANK